MSKIGLWTVFWKTAIERKGFKKRNGWWTCVKWGSPCNDAFQSHNPGPQISIPWSQGLFLAFHLLHRLSSRILPLFCFKILNPKASNEGNYPGSRKTCWGPSKTVSYSSKPPTQTFIVSFRSFLSPECLWGS